MAFNSEFIKATKLTSQISSDIAGHVLANGVDDALTLTGLSGVMTLTQLNSSVVNADSLIACSQFEPAVSGDPIVLNSDVSIANFNLNNVKDINFTTNGTVNGLTSISSDGVVPTTFTNDITVNGNIKNPQNIMMAQNGAITNLSNITATENTFVQFNSSIQFSGTGGGSISNITELNGIEDRISVLKDLDMNTTTIRQLGGLTINSGDPGVAGQVLSTTGNGLLWVDNGGGGSGADWSSYPATQQVDLDGNSIANGDVITCQNITSTSVNTLSLGEPNNNIISVNADLDLNSTQTLKSVLKLTTASDTAGTSGQVLSADSSGNLAWITPSGGDASQWATFPASQTVDMGAFNITNVDTIEGPEGSQVVFPTSIDLLGSTIYNTNIITVSNQTEGLRVAGDLRVSNGRRLFTNVINPSLANGDINIGSNLNFSAGGKISNISELNGNGDITVGSSLAMGGSDIKELSRLSVATGSFGTAGQVLTTGGSAGSLTWQNAGGGSATAWSQYPATQAVDIASQNINNVATINTSNVATTGITTQNLTSNTGTMTINDGTLNIKQNNETTMQVEAGGVFQIRGNNGQFFMYNTSDATATILASTAGNFFNSNNNASMSGWGTINCGSVEATNLTGTNISGQNLTSATGTLNVNDAILSLNQSNVPVFQMEPTGQFSMIGNNGEFRMYNDSSNNSTIYASTEGNFLNTTNGASMSGWANISCDFLNAGSIITPMRVERVYYVSPTGDDDTGNGSYLLPFRTIQKALTITEALSDSEYCYIKVMQGLYDGIINITRKVYIQGLGTSPFEASTGCYFSGEVNIDLQTVGGGMFNNAVNISGLLLASTLNYTSSYDGCLNIENCYFYTNDDEEGYAINFNPTSPDGRLRITNSLIVSGGSNGIEPLIKISKAGLLTMNNCQITAKGLQTCLRFAGTATCDTINFCKFTNTNTSASVPALCEIVSTNSGIYTWTNCGFVYSSSTNKAGNINASGILSNPSAGNPNIISLYNSFFLAGTVNPQNHAIQDLKAGTVNQYICLFFSNNASLGNASGIRGTNNTNKFQLTTVQ